jgi:hypothetical protein
MTTVVEETVSEEGQRPECWWLIGDKGIGEILEEYEGKKVRVTIEELAPSVS